MSYVTKPLLNKAVLQKLNRMPRFYERNQRLLLQVTAQIFLPSTSWSVCLHSSASKDFILEAFILYRLLSVMVHIAVMLTCTSSLTLALAAWMYHATLATCFSVPSYPVMDLIMHGLASEKGPYTLMSVFTCGATH